MSGRANRHPPSLLALKLATRMAVEAAGGQSFVAQEVGRAQSRVSDYCSPNTDDFMPLDVAAHVEDLGEGAPGHPHITRALARRQGVALGAGLSGEGLADDLGGWLASIAAEHADLLHVLAAEDMAAALHELSPSARARIHREAAQSIRVMQRLLHALGDDGAAGAAEPGVQGNDSS